MIYYLLHTVWHAVNVEKVPYYSCESKKNEKDAALGLPTLAGRKLIICTRKDAAMWSSYIIQIVL